MQASEPGGIFCAWCGMTSPAESRFCRNCHTIFTAASLEAAPAAILYAGFWSRAFALLIDVALLVFATVFPIATVSLFTMIDWTETLAPYLNVALLILSWLYFAALESSDRQATFGKMVLGIFVVDHNGGRLSFGRASGRFFARLFSCVFWFAGFVMVAFTAEKQALHDLLAGSRVIRERYTPIPNEYPDWSASCYISRAQRRAALVVHCSMRSRRSRKKKPPSSSSRPSRPMIAQ